MEHPVHYLKLAYLAETAIVFNLAYIELSWKKQFEGLSSRMNSLSASTLTAFNKQTSDSVCNKSKCSKCHDNNHTGNVYGIYDTEHLSELVTIITSGASQNNRSILFKAWQYGDFHTVTKYFLSWFHYLVNNFYDRKASFISLITASIVLVVISMVDNNIDFIFNLLSNAGAWESIGSWSYYLLNILLISMVMPGALWVSWKILLRKYECLGFSLINAYQKKSSGDFNKSINSLPI